MDRIAIVGVVLVGCVAAPIEPQQDSRATDPDADGATSMLPGDADGATSKGPGIDQPEPITTMTTGADAETGFDPTAPTTSDIDTGDVSDGGEGSDGGIDFEPIVFVLGSAGVTGMEVAGFAGLEYFVPDWDEQACEIPPDCAGNAAPQIEFAMFWINGAYAANGAGIQVGDRVGVLFSFDDPGCNVSCGESGSWLTEPFAEGAGGGSLGANIPCSTDASGVYLGIELYEVDDPGMYTAQVMLTDACGSQSGWSMVSFQVAP